MFEFKNVDIREDAVFSLDKDPVNPVHVGDFTSLYSGYVAIDFNRDTEGLIPEKLEGKRFFFDPKTHALTNDLGGAVTARYYGDESFSTLWALIGLYYTPEV